MKRISNKILVLISIICFIISGIVVYYSYLNIDRYKETSRVYKNQNQRLKEKIKGTEDDINNINSKLSLIDNKLEDLNKKIKIYEELKLVNRKEDFEKYLISASDFNLDKSRLESLANNSSRYRKLRSTYFNDYEVSSYDEALSNILINSLLANEIQASNINKKIVESNNSIFKNVGLYNFYNNTNNYLIKSLIGENINKGIYPIKEEDILKNDQKILDLKNKNFILFDTLLFPSDSNFMYLNNVKNIINNERKSISYSNNFNLLGEDEIEKFDRTMLFGIDTYSQNIDFEKNYDILDKTFETNQGVQVLRYLLDKRGRVYLIEERVNGEAKTLSYFDSSASPFIQVDINNYKIYYFNKDANKKSNKRYNHSLELLNKYKRD